MADLIPEEAFTSENETVRESAEVQTFKGLVEQDFGFDLADLYTLGDEDAVWVFGVGGPA